MAALNGDGYSESRAMSGTAIAPDVGRLAALVSLAASAYFLVAAVAAHLLSPRYDFYADYISDYAIGPFGWIYGSAFWASCVGCIALAVAMWRSVPAAALSRAGALLLVVVGITYAVDFAFPTDILPPGAPPATLAGQIHLADALLGWVLFVISALLLSARLKNAPELKAWRLALSCLAWLSLPLLVALVIVAIAGVPYGGLGEKAFILDRNVWAIVAAILAYRLSAASASSR